MDTIDNRGKSWVLALASLGAFMVILDAMVVATALGTIRRDLGASMEALQWTVSAFNLTFSVLLITGAALGDRFGRRRVFVAGLAGFVLASAICALAPNATWLIAARALQGASGALVTPLAMALISAAFPPAERGRALGIFTGTGGLALIVGPALGGAIAQGAAWQWIFWINLPIGLVLIPLALRRIPESRGANERLDLGGVALASLGALGIVWGLISGNGAGWTSPAVAASLLVGLAAAIAFILWERRVAAPMVPMRLFAGRTFSAANAACFLFTASLYGTVFLLPQYLQSALGYGPFGAGLRILPWTATLFVIAPISGGLVNRLGARTLMAVGLAVQAASFLWLAGLLGPDHAYGEMVLPLILSGTGLSMAMPAAQTAVLASVARPDLGKAAGVYNMLRFLGSVAGVALAVAVFARAGGDIAIPATFAPGLAASITAGAILSALGALAALWVRPAPAAVAAPRTADAPASSPFVPAEAETQP